MEYEAIRDLASKPYIIQCNDSVSIAHFHTSIELIYVIAGKVSFSSNGKNYTLFPTRSPSPTVINCTVTPRFPAARRSISSFNRNF